MDKSDFEKLTRLREREARHLGKGGYAAGAYYLLGYAVECALKACIATQFKSETWPDKSFVNMIWSHDLEQLRQAAGISEPTRGTPLEVNWTLVRNGWSVDVRYRESVLKIEFDDFFRACLYKNGVLPWIKSQW